MPAVNTHSLNSYCLDVLDMILLFSLNSTTFKSSQSEGCSVLHRTLMNTDFISSLLYKENTQIGDIFSPLLRKVLEIVLSLFFCHCQIFLPCKNKFKIPSTFTFHIDIIHTMI